MAIKKRALGNVLGRDANAIMVQKYLARFHYTEEDALVHAQENIDIQTGGLLIVDGLQLKAGSIVLLTKQTDKKENGLYTAQSGAWERLQGYENSDDQAYSFKYIYVQSGTDVGKIYTVATQEHEIGLTDIEFIETAFSPNSLPEKIVIRDRYGKFAGSGSGGSDPGDPGDPPIPPVEGGTSFGENVYFGQEEFYFGGPAPEALPPPPPEYTGTHFGNGNVHFGQEDIYFNNEPDG